MKWGVKWSHLRADVRGASRLGVLPRHRQAVVREHKLAHAVLLAGEQRPVGREQLVQTDLPDLRRQFSEQIARPTSQR